MTMVYNIKNDTIVVGEKNKLNTITNSKLVGSSRLFLTLRKRSLTKQLVTVY